MRKIPLLQELSADIYKYFGQFRQVYGKPGDARGERADQSFRARDAGVGVAESVCLFACRVGELARGFIDCAVSASTEALVAAYPVAVGVGAGVSGAISGADIGGFEVIGEDDRALSAEAGQQRGGGQCGECGFHIVDLLQA